VSQEFDGHGRIETRLGQEHLVGSKQALLFKPLEGHEIGNPRLVDQDRLSRVDKLRLDVACNVLAILARSLLLGIH
jgi:hypothetical protein